MKLIRPRSHGFDYEDLFDPQPKREVYIVQDANPDMSDCLELFSLVYGKFTYVDDAPMPDIIVLYFGHELTFSRIRNKLFFTCDTNSLGYLEKRLDYFNRCAKDSAGHIFYAPSWIDDILFTDENADSNDESDGGE